MTKERARSQTGPPETRAGTRGTYARGRKRRKSGLPSWAYILGVAAVVVLIGAGAMTLLGQGGARGSATAGNVGTSGGAEPTGVQLPRYAYAAPSVLEGYQYALTPAGQDVLKYMPCYCGCGDHSGHKSNLNCFIQDPAAGKPLVFDNHASTWDICVDIARDAKNQVAQGKSLIDVRRFIEAKYSSRGPGSETPLPPAT